MRLRTVAELLTLMVVAYAATRAWLVLFGHRFYRALMFNGFIDSKMPDGTGLRTGFTSFVPPDAIYVAAVVSVGLAFFALNGRRNRSWVRSTLFFLLVFVAFQTLGGCLWSYYVGAFYDPDVFNYSTANVSSVERTLFTLTRLPMVTFLSMTLGVGVMAGLCPVVALATALVSLLFYPRRPVG